MFLCGFRVTFGCPFGALVWVSGDFRVTSGCLSGVFVRVSGDFRVTSWSREKANAHAIGLISGCAPFGPLKFLKRQSGAGTPKGAMRRWGGRPRDIVQGARWPKGAAREFRTG